VTEVGVPVEMDESDAPSLGERGPDAEQKAAIAADYERDVIRREQPSDTTREASRVLEDGRLDPLASGPDGARLS
jgi:hypothetical protein